jgi:hypothetical protein
VTYGLGNRRSVRLSYGGERERDTAAAAGGQAGALGDIMLHYVFHENSAQELVARPGSRRAAPVAAIMFATGRSPVDGCLKWEDSCFWIVVADRYTQNT